MEKVKDMVNLYRCMIIIDVDGEEKASQLNELIDKFLDEVFLKIKPVTMKKKWGW